MDKNKKWFEVTYRSNMGDGSVVVEAASEEEARFIAAQKITSGETAVFVAEKIEPHPGPAKT